MGHRVAGGLAVVLLALAALALWLRPQAPLPQRAAPRPQPVVQEPSAGTGAAPFPTPVAPPAPARVRDEEREPADAGRAQARVVEPPSVPPDLLPPPRGERTLSRARVEEALAREPQLDRQFRSTRTVHDGHRLLKLGVVEPGSFYAELGLESRDVLVLVNGEWVTDRDNPLWDALRGGDALVLVVMRQGTSRSWRVRIE